MAGPMSVSMTIKIIDESTAAVRGITGAVRELKQAGDALNAGGIQAGAARWDAEKEAVQGVIAEVKTLGGAQQNVGSISAATAAYREEAGAVDGVIAAGERLVDMVRRQADERRTAFRASQAEMAGGADDGIAKLSQEGAEVDAVTAKLREMGTAARGSGSTSLPGQVDWGQQAGKERDWNAYWRERGLLPGGEGEPEPSVTHAQVPREPEAPKSATELTNAQPAGSGGLISMIVGGAELGSGLKLVRGSYEQAADAASQRAAMRAAGLPEGEQAQLAAAASRVSREKRTFSENETMDLVRDARTILGSTSHAIEALPSIVDLATLAEAKRPGQGMEGVMALLKGMETNGATITPERFGELSQSIAKVTNVFGKTLGAVDWGQMFKFGGTATQHLSPEFVEQKAPHLMQELGGSSTGTMLQTMYRAIVAGRMDKGAKETMEHYGLYDPKTEKVKGADIFMRDPSEWVMGTLKPALDAAHLTGEDRASVEDKMFSSRLTARGISILETQDAAVEKNAKQIRDAQGLEAAPELARTDPRLVSRGMEAQSSNFERRAGDPVMSPLVTMENAYTTLLGRMNGMFDKVPGAATAAAAGVVGGAGYLGWKTWESGLGNTMKSLVRLPESAGRGLLEGVKDGVAQARAEAGQPSAARAAPVEAPAAQGLASVGEAASTAAGRFAALSTDLGTVGLMIAWASKSDIGLHRDLAPSSLAQNPLGIRLPGDPGVPAAEAARAVAPAVQAITDALREQARRSADEFRREPEAARGRAMANIGPDAPAGQGLSVSSIQAMLTPLEAGVRGAVAAALANHGAGSFQPVTTAAQPPGQVTNNNQKTISAPITVTAPITINATLTNTTPGAIANTVARGVHEGVRAGTAALHDGTETR